jgi:TM2 domain-containing membrane protein YozV
MKNINKIEICYTGVISLNKNIATVLSFLICGLGQIYKGFVLKGIALFMTFALFCSLGWLSYRQSINYEYKATIEELETVINDYSISNKEYSDNEILAGVDKAEADLVKATNDLSSLLEEGYKSKSANYHKYMILLFIGALLVWLFNIYDANKSNIKIMDNKEDQNLL